MAIIGGGFGGFGGVCAAIKLLEQGRDDFLLFEKAASLGGTWRDNNYLRCGCDVRSHLYSYSFAQHPGWSRTYASQPEILAYLGRVAEHYGVKRKARFETEIVSAHWDANACCWRLASADGRNLTDDWRSGPEAFRGVAVAGFPNLFLLVGPNTALSHNSIIFMIESQVCYILQCLAWLDAPGPRGKRLSTVEVRADAQREFNAAIQKKFDRSVWQTTKRPWYRPCVSWYVHESGRNHVIWPGFSASYWWAMRTPDRQDFVFDTANG